MADAPPSREPPSGPDVTDHFDKVFSASDRVEDAPIPRQRHFGKPRLITLCPPRPPETLICAFGPCRHYVTQVMYLETANEDPVSVAGSVALVGDSTMHTIREHRCLLTGQDLQDEQLFECSAWWPRFWRRLALRLRGQSPVSLLAPLLAKAIASEAFAEADDGIGPCRVCGKGREQSGIIDVSGRHSIQPDIARWCWCGHRDKVPTTWEEANHA